MKTSAEKTGVDANRLHWLLNHCEPWRAAKIIFAWQHDFKDPREEIDRQMAKKERWHTGS